MAVVRINTLTPYRDGGFTTFDGDASARVLSDEENSVPPAGIEPTTFPLGEGCSILLSYGGIVAIATK